MLKAGVRILGIRPELVLGLMIAQEVYRTFGVLSLFVITSVMDGTHSTGSLHYAGAGVDLRRPSTHVVDQLVIALRNALGEDFDVILESDHIHMEFQPKRPY